MSYIGSTPTNQSFIAGTDSFNGTGSATNFTLSRSVNSTNDIQVVVNNVVQYPPNYSVSGNTLTISPAPSAGTNNVYVRYLSTTLQSVAPVSGITQQFASGTAANPSITFIGDANTGIFSPAADTIAFSEGGSQVVTIASTGSVGIGTTTPDANILNGTPILRVQGTGAGFVLNDTSSAGSYAILARTGASTNLFRIFDITAAADRLTINSSGNVGIGTDSPGAKLDVNGPSSVTSFTGTTRLGITVRGSTSTNDYSGIDFLGAGSNLTARIAVLSTGGGSFLTFGTSNSYASGITNTAMSIDPTGNFQFNSGYGSVATAYGCRAWVNFNGTGTVAIRASGNVSSITDLGTGDFRANFTTAMPDANYTQVWGAGSGAGSGSYFTSTIFFAPTTSNCSVRTTNSGGALQDAAFVTLAVFR
jgi:hypothetical protein